MRKIERSILSAFAPGGNGKFGNTEVRTTWMAGQGTTVKLLVHGSPVVIVEYGLLSKVRVSLCGFDTMLTRSRINLALDTIGAGRLYRKYGRTYWAQPGNIDIPMPDTGTIELALKKSGEAIRAGDSK